MSDSKLQSYSLFKLTWPLFIDFALHFLTGALNTFMIGHVSYQGVAALAVGNQVFQLAITSFGFVTIGASVVITQYLGAKNAETAKKVIYSSVGFNLMLGLIAASGIILGAGHILSLMNMPQNLMSDGQIYLQIIGLCLLPEAIALCFAAAIRAHGFTLQAMWVTLLMNIVTFFGNLLLLYGWFGLPEMGVAGVAVSTVIGRIVGVILLGYLLAKYTGIKLSIAAVFKVDKTILKKIFHIGLPAAGENVSWMLQFMVITAFVALLGDKMLAAHSFYFQICTFILLFNLSIGLANEIVIGHMVGAGLLKQAYRQLYKALKLGFVVTAIVALIVFFSGEHIISLFTQESEIITIVSSLFIITLIMEPGRAFNLIVINALRATGDARFPLYAGLFSMWGIAVPFAYFFAIYLEIGLIGIWIALAMDEWTRGLLMFWRWRSGRWQNKSLIET